MKDDDAEDECGEEDGEDRVDGIDVGAVGCVEEVEADVDDEEAES